MLPSVSRSKLLLILLIILPLVACSGCGGKKMKPWLSGRTSKHKKQKRYNKATQRPYMIKGIKYYPIPSAVGYEEKGIASWYGEPFHGRKTSNGEIYDMYGDTAAHKTLPMDTMLLVKNLENGKSTTVRINDRGPFVQDRIIDLTYSKAKELGIVAHGTAKVEIIAMAKKDVVEETMLAQEEQAKQPTVATTTPGAVPSIGEKTPKKEAAHSSAPAPLPDFDKGTFYVQVGAFVKIDNARKLAKAFASKGRDVIIQQYPAAGMNLYRVLIFASHSLAQAKVYEKQLESQGFRYALLLAR